MAGLISLDQAIGLVSDSVNPLGSEIIELASAAGRVLAARVYARSAAPRRAIAAMDGYAVCNATTVPGMPLRIIGESRAGRGFAGTLAAGEAVRIFTGAPNPVGADRCIMQEYAEREGDMVRFSEGYGPGWHVRSAGSDFAAGDLLLDQGTMLSPRAMVAAAAADVAELSVARCPRVAIIGTGDELVHPGTAFDRLDAIPESVTYGIAAMVAEAGGIVVKKALALDDLPTLEGIAGQMLDAADLVIVTGGASVGERDFAKAMFGPHGLQVLFGKVAIKPGKPVWFGRAGRVWVLGLPGNPTSAMVTATLFLRPLLASMLGRPIAEVMRWRKLPLAAPLGATGKRETLVRAFSTEGGLQPVENQDSGAQAALVHSDWLIRSPAGSHERTAGELVTALPF